MKRGIKLAILMMGMILTLAPTFVCAFNPGTHLYIAEQVFKDCSPKINLYYGSIAPDLSLYVANPGDWPTAFDNTHHAYLDLGPYAFGSTQKAFSKGWLTHNEEWGADYYAHIDYPPRFGGYGYVIGKAEALSESTCLDPEFAHYAVEVAIDLLLKRNDPKIGAKLLTANLFRSWQDRYLLSKMFVWREGVTDWQTLASAELTFRGLVHRYAMALALPEPLDKQTLAELGVLLASEMYGIEITAVEVGGLLEEAMVLCSEAGDGNYRAVIDYVIEEIKNNI